MMYIRNQFRKLNQEAQEAYDPIMTRPQPNAKNVDDPIHIRASSIPQNVAINNGQMEDLAWVSKTRMNQTEAVQPKIVVENVRKRTFVNDNYDAGTAPSTQIYYDDVPNIPESVVSNAQELENTGLYSEVGYGEYILICNGETLGFGNLKAITDAVESILLTDETVSPNSLIVLKRMNVMTGVLIQDV